LSVNITLYLFPELAKERDFKPVNVSSVPQRSPFRYPGGKTWFVPTFRRWVAQLPQKPVVLVEPFAGGGIISLTALFENLVEKAIMVELDEEIAAVWRVVAKGQAKWLADRILNFDLSTESVLKEIRKKTRSLREMAFRTILKNRTFHGGILAEGSGFLKYGENGKGIHSRWYPVTLAKRFNDLNSVAKRIEFKQEDGIKILEEYTNDKNTIFFIDPPYTAGGKQAGKRLYKHYELDHERLFLICERLKGEFLITYDIADEVKQLAKKHNFETRPIPMKNTHHADMRELVIGKDLSWMN
jgi:DNA adenine methylase